MIMVPAKSKYLREKLTQKSLDLSPLNHQLFLVFLSEQLQAIFSVKVCLFSDTIR